jgi:hypothetical protein
MKRKLTVLIAIISLAVAALAWAATDYNCMNDCLARGYLYGYCKRVCSY